MACWWLPAISTSKECRDLRQLRPARPRNRLVPQVARRLAVADQFLARGQSIWPVVNPFQVWPFSRSAELRGGKLERLPADQVVEEVEGRLHLNYLTSGQSMSTRGQLRGGGTQAPRRPRPSLSPGISQPTQTRERRGSRERPSAKAFCGTRGCHMWMRGWY